MVQVRAQQNPFKIVVFLLIFKTTTTDFLVHLATVRYTIFPSYKTKYFLEYYYYS